MLRVVDEQSGKYAGTADGVLLDAVEQQWARGDALNPDMVFELLERLIRANAPTTSLEEVQELWGMTQAVDPPTDDTEVLALRAITLTLGQARRRERVLHREIALLQKQNDLLEAAKDSTGLPWLILMFGFANLVLVTVILLQVAS